MFRMLAIAALLALAPASLLAQDEATLRRHFEGRTVFERALERETDCRRHAGLSEAEVDRLLGAPMARTARTEGSLAVTVRRYERDDASVEAMFVEGVLVRYTVGPR